MLEKLIEFVDNRLKLSAKEREKIRKAKCARTVDVYELAVKYGVSPSTIYRIRKEEK